MMVDNADFEPEDLGIDSASGSSALPRPKAKGKASAKSSPKGLPAPPNAVAKTIAKGQQNNKGKGKSKSKSEDGVIIKTPELQKKLIELEKRDVTLTTVLADLKANDEMNKYTQQQQQDLEQAISDLAPIKINLKTVLTTKKSMNNTALTQGDIDNLYDAINNHALAWWRS